MECTCTVAEIEAFCGGVNAPGLDRTLFWTCYDELASIPAAGTASHTISTPITYRAAVSGPPAVAAGKFFKLAISKENMSFESERDENGLWKTVVKCFVPKLETEKTYVFNGMTSDNIVLVVPDKNGKKRLVGGIGDGAMMKVKETTNPKNGYELSFEWESASAPFFYTGTITI